MNASTALARVLVDELVRGGVREAVLSPGSRNAPLSFALYDADAAGRLRLHVRIDERTAGFLALGLAKASGAPVPVVTTSGTAAANLHPAVVEAHQSGVPLLVLTADRPTELRGTGANQTIDQVKLYGDAVRLFADVGAPEERAGQVAYWRALACRCLAAARGGFTANPGPAHLNLGLREPLVPEADDGWVEPLDGRPDGQPWTAVSGVATAAGPPYPGSARTLVLIGDCPPALGYDAVRLARARRWPVLAEPVTDAWAGSLGSVALLLASDVLARHRPDRVLVVGRPTLSRTVGALLRDPAVAVDVVSSSPQWADPPASAETVTPGSWLTGLPPGGRERSWTMRWGPEPVNGDAGFLAGWQRGARVVADAVDGFLDAEPRLTGLHVARALVGALPVSPRPLLVLGSSSVVRDVDLVGNGAQRQLHVLANRGAAGIDGTVSTAVGAALAHQHAQRLERAEPSPAYALMGDLTFLHDANGLLIGPNEPRPNLTLVVVNDDGGGIFGRLEQGAPEHAGAFERVFGTPTGVDLAALCAATRTPHARAATADQLQDLLTPEAGVRVVEVRTDRRVAPDLHERLGAAVAAAL